MFLRQHSNLEGDNLFFLIAFSHESLMNYMATNFSLMQNFNYTLSDLEGMMPWERDIYLRMLIEHLKEEKKRMDEARNSH